MDSDKTDNNKENPINLWWNHSWDSLMFWRTDILVKKGFSHAVYIVEVNKNSKPSVLKLVTLFPQDGLQSNI